MANFFRNPKYAWLNKPLTCFLAFSMLFYMNLAVTTFGMLKVLEAATDLVAKVSNLNSMINGYVYSIDAVKTPKPKRVPLGYLDDTGNLSGPVAHVMIADKLTPLTVRDVKLTQDENFRYDSGTPEFAAVNVYYHIQQARHYLLSLGYDRLGSHLDINMADYENHLPLGDVIDRAYVVYDVYKDKTIDLDSDRELYFDMESATDATCIYFKYFRKVLQSLIPDVKMLEAYALFLAYSCGGRKYKKTSDYYPMKDGETVTDYEVISKDIDADYADMSGLVDAMWKLREVISSEDAEMISAIAALLYKERDGPKDIGLAFAQVDAQLFEGKYAADIELMKTLLMMSPQLMLLIFNPSQTKSFRSMIK